MKDAIFRNIHRITYIKSYNMNQWQLITGQIAESKRFSCKESSRTNSTKYIPQKEKKNTKPDALKRNREKKSKKNLYTNKHTEEYTEKDRKGDQ